MRPFPIKRFAAGIAASSPVVIGISLIGESADWSYGASFTALAAVGTVASLVILRENPFTWPRHRPEKRRGENPA
jgi:hypothetical protein